MTRFHGQLWGVCSLRLEGPCRATFSSQLPPTPSPEPLLCHGLWVAKGEVLARAGELPVKTACPTARPLAFAQPLAAPPHALSELWPFSRWLSHFPALPHGRSHFLFLSQEKWGEVGVVFYLSLLRREAHGGP